MANQLDKHFIKAFDMLDKMKDAAKVCISHCTQVSNLSVVNTVIRSCLETIETCDLCKLFMINRSPNVKKAIVFTIAVLKTTENECKKLCEDKHCMNTMKICGKIASDTINELQSINKMINNKNR